MLVDGGIAVIEGFGAPIVGEHPQSGPAIAYLRPDGFSVETGAGLGFPARVRNLILAGPDARIDCALDRGGSIEVRVSHEEAGKLSPRERIRLRPRRVRVWPSTGG